MVLVLYIDLIRFYFLVTGVKCSCISLNTSERLSDIMLDKNLVTMKNYFAKWELEQEISWFV
jgi:hypothetical protein